MDLRRAKTPVTPVSIQGVPVDTVEEYKYLGVYFNNKLDWNRSTEAVYKKAKADRNPCRLIQRLQQATHRTGMKLGLDWIFGGYSPGSSRDFTEVRPVLAAGGRLAHLPEPCAESLETDLGTVIKFQTRRLFCCKLDECSFYCTLVLPLFYINTNMHFFLNSFHVMWPTDF